MKDSCTCLCPVNEWVTLISKLCQCFMCTNEITLLVINPCMKLEWFQHHQPNDLKKVQELLLKEVSWNYNIWFTVLCIKVGTKETYVNRPKFHFSVTLACGLLFPSHFWVFESMHTACSFSSHHAILQDIQGHQAHCHQTIWRWHSWASWHLGLLEDFSQDFRIWKLWKETGNIVNRNIGTHGCPQIFAYEDIEYLCCVIRHQPDWFLDELDFLLCTNHFIAAHYTTIHWELLRVGITGKKLKKVTLERNENVCADYIWCMAQYDPEQVGFRMRCQRMSTPQDGIVADWERELALFRRVFLWEEEDFLQRGY